MATKSTYKGPEPKGLTKNEMEAAIRLADMHGHSEMAGTILAHTTEICCLFVDPVPFSDFFTDCIQSNLTGVDSTPLREKYNIVSSSDEDEDKKFTPTFRDLFSPLLSGTHLNPTSDVYFGKILWRDWFNKLKINPDNINYRLFEFIAHRFLTQSDRRKWVLHHARHMLSDRYNHYNRTFIDAIKYLANKNELQFRDLCLDHIHTIIDSNSIHCPIITSQRTYEEIEF